MSKAIISAEHLGKKYIIGEHLQGRGARTFRDAFDYQLNKIFRRGGQNHKSDTILWALKDVSFEVQQGEVLGIIGRNGAGKSTLLKVLSRITEPTEGKVTLRGRVASLLEVGTGFSMELTGRENIYLNGAILGMLKAEIDKKFDEIVSFAEIEKFIDTPVKRYSSGMHVRLAFAVAAHLEPEILLVDEVLAVGDVAFQKKCLAKMGDVGKEGRTVLFVSHNMAAVQALCGSAMCFDAGQLIAEGNVGEVVGLYLRTVEEAMSSVSLADRVDRDGDGNLRFVSAVLLNRDYQEVSVGQCGEDLVIVLEYTRGRESQTQAVVRIGVTDAYGHRLFMCLSRASSNDLLRLGLKGKIRCTLPRLPLLPGSYTVSLWCKIGGQMADHIENAFSFQVVGGDFFGTGKLYPSDGGSMLVDHTWEVV